MKTKFQRGDHVVNVASWSRNFRKQDVVEEVLRWRTMIGYIEERLLLVGVDNSGRRGPHTGFDARNYERLDVLKAQAAARAELRRMTGGDT